MISHPFSYQELGLLLVLVAVAILTYSSLVYFAEKEIPDGDNRRLLTTMTFSFSWQ